MSFKYSRYINHVTRHPWAILPEKLDVLMELARFRAAGNRLSDEEIVDRLAADGDRRSVARSDGMVAVIPVHGVIAYRADSFDASSGGTSTELIGRVLQRAVADESIKAIVLDFDTPGGSVDGVMELGAQIFAARSVKPIIASVNALAASAGYWLASQADEITITPSGMAGSIGVYLILVDQTEALKKLGVKVNAISAGDNKLEGAPFQELSDESRAHFQSQVDEAYRDFKAAVARGRGITSAEVEKNYGRGRVFTAREALKIGLVDRIETFDATLARVARGNTRKAGRAAEAIVSETIAEDVGVVVDELHAHADATVTDALAEAAAESNQVEADLDALDLL